MAYVQNTASHSLRLRQSATGPVQGVSHTPSGGLIPPNFRTTPPVSYLDNPPNISQGVLNIIITFAKYEQYLVYVMFIVDSDGGYLFIEFCIKIENSA